MTTVIQFPERDRRPLVAHISDEVRALMGRHQVSQTALAAWLGITQPAISARLRGATEWKVSEVDRIAEGFGIHPSELMGGHYTGPRPDGPEGMPIKGGRPTIGGPDDGSFTISYPKSGSLLAFPLRDLAAAA